MADAGTGDVTRDTRNGGGDISSLRGTSDEWLHKHWNLARKSGDVVSQRIIIAEWTRRADEAEAAKPRPMSDREAIIALIDLLGRGSECSLEEFRISIERIKSRLMA